MWQCCPKCHTYLSNFCREKKFHKWHSDTAEPVDSMLDQWTPWTLCLLSLQCPWPWYHSTIMSLQSICAHHYVGPIKRHEHNVTSLQCKWLPKLCSLWCMCVYNQRWRNSCSMSPKWYHHPECPVCSVGSLFCVHKLLCIYGLLFI